VTTTLAKTPLFDWHAAHGGRMVDFAGWSMPVQYSSIVTEHNATRTAAGLFDVSHMGRLRFTGDNVTEFLDGLATRRVSDMQPGQIRYSLLTNEHGGILDDVLIYRLADRAGTPQYSMVVNASNRQKIWEWIKQRLANRHDIGCVDNTLSSAMIAVQGPAALDLLKSRVDANLSAIKYYHAVETTLTGHWAVASRTGYAALAGRKVIVSRTGYTGEDGFELIVSGRFALDVWVSILEDGKDRGVIAAGLGARDTLRLEAAMPLYGHELNEEITPIEVGLDFAVNLKDRRFPGSETLATIKRDGPKRVRVGLELAGKRVPREHYGIYAGGKAIGEVTSGTFSPTLQKPIAMGYVPPQFREPGTEVTIDIRGSQEPARVVKVPFYRRAN
jgi:aminomethyltransferase